jgi:flagellar biosynthesis chaperone FliJ
MKERLKKEYTRILRMLLKSQLEVKNKMKPTGALAFSAKYLNTKYKVDRFVNTVKSHESNQQNINSTIKTAAKFVGELNRSNENSDIKKEGIQHTKASSGESL